MSCDPPKFFRMIVSLLPPSLGGGVGRWLLGMNKHVIFTGSVSVRESVWEPSAAGVGWVTGGGDLPPA